MILQHTAFRSTLKTADYEHTIWATRFLPYTLIHRRTMYHVTKNIQKHFIEKKIQLGQIALKCSNAIDFCVWISLKQMLKNFFLSNLVREFWPFDSLSTSWKFFELFSHCTAIGKRGEKFSLNLYRTVSSISLYK